VHLAHALVDVEYLARLGVLDEDCVVRLVEDLSVARPRALALDDVTDAVGEDVVLLAPGVLDRGDELAQRRPYDVGRALLYRLLLLLGRDAADE
jgi:hypothetical protein